MVASIPYIKSSEPHLLETYAPEVTKAYITSRLDAVPVILRLVLKNEVVPNFLQCFVSKFPMGYLQGFYKVLKSLKCENWFLRPKKS